MPSRFYFPADTVADVSPAFDGSWGGTSQAVRRKLASTKGSSAIADGTAISLPGASNRSRLDRQYVSAPLAAQTIRGTVKMQLVVRESNADDNIDRLMLSIRVLSNDGAVARGTLLALGNYGPTTEYSTTQTNKSGADGDAVSTVVALAGDRIVVEIGHLNSTTGTTPNATARWGEAATDLPESEGIFIGDGAGWIEFSDTILPYNPGAAPLPFAQIDLRFLHRQLTLSLEEPTQYTAGSGTTQSVVAAALTEADDYWNGALVRWDGGGNAGLWSAAADFVSASDRIDFVDPLPVAVAAGDTFTLFQGGKFASSERIPGLRAPTFTAVTGFTVVHAACLNGEGTGVVSFSEATGTLTWTPPGEVEPGPAVPVTALGVGDRVTLNGPGEGVDEAPRLLTLERTAAALPASDAADDVSLDIEPSAFLARVLGSLAAAGSTTYWPLAVVNAGAPTVTEVKTYVGMVLDGAAASTLTATLGTGAGTLVAADIAGWGASGWVRNTTKNDVRYYYDRTGNSAAVLSPGAGHRGFTAVAWDVGDSIEVYPWIDIGLDAPGALNVFEDPATRSTAPSGVSFSCPRTIGDALSIGTLVFAAVHAIWMRLEVPAGARPLEGGRVDLRVRARV